MPSIVARPTRSFALPAALALLALPAATLGAQAAHPRVCADGVRKYAALSEVPTPYDSLTMPRGEPIRVTSPEEEKAADLEMLKRAGSVGATGVVVTEDVQDDGSRRMVNRRTIPVFVASDTARAYGACKGK